MNIIVFIKQIPDSDEVKLDENGNLIRSGAGTMINPVDKNAIEAGLSLRDRFGGKVTAVTMGPPQAEDVLKRALFMGCDEAVLLSDRAFGGADTLATGYVLSMAAKKRASSDFLLSRALTVSSLTAVRSYAAAASQTASKHRRPNSRPLSRSPLQ